MTTRSRLLILLLAVIGLGVSAEATWIHHKLLTDAAYTPPCNLNATFNCSQVYLSAYGSVQGVPVALFGVVWFAFVALVAAFANTSAKGAEDHPAGAYVFAASTIGLAVILSLGYASFVVLKTYCILCLATYAAVIGIFVASGLTASVPMMSLPGRLVRDIKNILARPAQMTAGLVYLVAVVCAIAFFPSTANSGPMTSSAAPPKLDNASAVKTSQESQDPHVQFEAWWNAQRRIETGVGLEGAKVVIVKFSDFQCPGCKQTWLMYSPVIKKYTEGQPGQVRYVMKDFPLQPQCNVAVQQQVHPFSCDAAAAYRLAVDRGKGEQMEKWIFDNQATLTGESIRGAARDIAGITNFDQLAPTKLAAIKKDTADGGALQISSTPTFYINGVQLPTGQWLNPEYFELAIQIELKKAGAAAPQKAGGE